MSSKLDVVSKPKGRDVGHDVVSAVRTKRTEPGFLEDRQKQIATCAIFVLQTVVVFRRQRKRISSCRLQRRRGSDGKKVVNFANRTGYLWRCDAVTDAPA